MSTIFSIQICEDGDFIHVSQSNKRDEAFLGFLLCIEQNTGPSVLETECHDWNLRDVISKKEAIFLVMNKPEWKRERWEIWKESTTDMSELLSECGGFLLCRLSVICLPNRVSDFTDCRFRSVQRLSVKHQSTASHQRGNRTSMVSRQQRHPQLPEWKT